MASSQHGGHHSEHHKKGSFFTRLFKNKRESQTDVHNHDHKDKAEDKDHKDKKHTITKSPSEASVQQTTDIANNHKKETDTAHTDTHPNNTKHEPTETKSTSKKELPPIPTTATTTTTTTTTTETTENKLTTAENKVVSNEPTTHNKTAETVIQQTTIKNNIPDSTQPTKHNHTNNNHHNNHHHPNPTVNGSDDSSAGTNGTHTDKTDRTDRINQSDRSSACYTDRSSTSYTDNDNNHNTNDSHNHQAHGVAVYTPLPFYEGSPKNMHASQPQKPRASGPPEILPEEIEYDTTADFLGQGSFGSVYKGRCRGQEVAVKIPRKQKLSLSELTSFRNEVKIMSKIYHPNVVLFLGACTQMGKMQIVTERCTTDLEKLLASKRPLSLYERMRMAKDAALGMNWLHGITRIVHNDLKSANLLVDNHMRVKVTDFGFSSIKEGDQFVDKAKKGTPLWMAPEVMMGQPYDDKADVYSFGIILWEIVTRDVPYKHHTDYNTFSRAVCHDHERPPLPADIMPSLKYLITNCWDHDPKNRPSFNELVFRISEVMVECMIENESARQLWKKYFLLPKQELFEQISWPDFAACIGQNLGLKNANDSADYLANVKRLLITLPQNTMGLVNEVVTMDRLDKTIKWFGKFFDPVEGPTVMKEINALAGESWFHWDISRDESTARLAGHEEGTFLVRLSSTDPRTTPFTLSLTGNQHRRIKRIPGGQYKLQGKHMIYSDLPALVQLCSDYKLLKPCPKVDISNPYAIDNMT